MAAAAILPAAIDAEFAPLQLESIIGFSGSVPQGHIKHPDGVHTIYSLGSTVVVSDSRVPNSQEFLQGHTNAVSCLAIDKPGRLVASGQVTHMGFQADIIIWDFKKRTAVHRFSLHKVKVQSVAFSPNSLYLASLGGEDDNSIIVWDLAKGAAICGSPASKDSSGATLCLAYLNRDDHSFVTGGDGTLRVWELNVAQRKVRPTDVVTGQIKRVVKCVVVDDKDEYMYCGTTTGDLLECKVATKLFKLSGPPKEKERFGMGIVSLALSPKHQSVMVGCGDGTIAALKLPRLNILKSAKVSGTVTSLTFDNQDCFYAGTAYSNIYYVSMNDFSPVMRSTGHYAPINDIAFPEHSSDVFATASDTDIRIWNAQTSSELLRIAVPNLECKCIVFKKDGSSLITGWNDGKIRAFGPQSGRLQYEIGDAHKGCVTALAVTECWNDAGEFRVISGGADGQVRVWRITSQHRTLEEAMKEHKGTITAIKIRKTDLECVSSSSDGSCIVWDLMRYVRNQVLFAPSFFKAVCYYPDESQLLTSGTDRKVGYWEAYDGSLIRELDASQSDAINGLDITTDGKYFVIGGSDKLVKIYLYEEGSVAFVGVGHSTDITKVKISPDQRHVVSVSADGAIFTWAFNPQAVTSGTLKIGA
ncbi:WD40-repeat-containing domain protein [Geranomyces variabilis]|nr:WD40-repeat-containing domain protein [Geranomyces variabilis]KAJ3138871.1 Cilia- and flagella-associated protein 52 [Geranomyces variabilis]